MCFVIFFFTSHIKRFKILIGEMAPTQIVLHGIDLFYGLDATIFLSCIF